jgi:hypothetical protein
MLVRAIALIVLVIICTATSCVTTAGLAVAPGPATPADSTVETVLAIADTAAKRRGLTLHPEGDHWRRCWARYNLREPTGHRSDLFLCGTVREREVQFLLRQVMTTELTWQADSLRLELLGALRTRYGGPAVRECEWQNDADPQRSGCLPLSVDSGNAGTAAARAAV